MNAQHKVNESFIRAAAAAKAEGWSHVTFHKDGIINQREKDILALYLYKIDGGGNVATDILLTADMVPRID